MFYIIENNNIQCANYIFENWCKEYPTLTMEEYSAHPNKVIIVGNELQPNPNYDEEEAEKERERVGNLQCTKRVFVLMLEELQLNYFEQILPVIEANRQAKLEWELCVELQRKNPLIDQLASQFGITSEQLDNLFKYANGEITIEQFRGGSNE